jgi:ion channel POLLUX/CASTOR
MGLRPRARSIGHLSSRITLNKLENLMQSKRRTSLLDRFERTLMKGSVLSILALGIATLVVVLVASATVSVLHIHATDSDLSFWDAVWEILQRAIDPGQLANESKWSSRITLLIVTGIGLLLMSTLISIVNSTIEQRIATTRHGRRPIEINGHIAIVGWNQLGTKYTEELAEARQDGELIQVLILADKDPVDLVNQIHDDLIRQKSLNATSSAIKHPELWLSARRGHIDHTADLVNLARIDTARAVIVLSRDGTDEDVVTSVMAIIAALQNMTPNNSEQLTIVAAFKDTTLGHRLRNRVSVLMKHQTSSQGRTCELIPVTSELVRSGIGSQVARHRGLSDIYRDLTDFDGEEIYLIPAAESSLVFSDLLHMDGATPLGLSKDEEIQLWPNWNTPISGQSVILLSRDRTAAKQALEAVSSHQTIDTLRLGRPVPETPESFLVIGWNSDAVDFIRDLRKSAPLGSKMTLLIDEDSNYPSDIGEQVDDLLIRSHLTDPVDDSSFLTRFNHVLVLSHDHLDDHQSDARVLMDILACRGHSHASAREAEPLTVVAELRHRASKHIAGARLADDLLVNDSLAASTTVQLAVHPELWPVLLALLTPRSPVQLVPLGNVLSDVTGLSIRDVRQRLATSTGEIPIALRRSDNLSHVTVNPSLQTIIGEGDEIVVLSRRV